MAALACLLAASCAHTDGGGGSEPAVGGFLGATRSDATFNSSPDGCAYSFLYDDFVARQEGEATDGAPSQTRGAALNAPSHAEGATVTIDVRGAALGAPGQAGVLRVEFAGAARDLTLIAGAQDDAATGFAHTVTATARAGENVLRIAVTLSPSDEPQDAREIHVDTADVALAGQTFCPGR